MPKSNYPSRLDTSVEIPAVRNNVLEAGADVINSLRSAIFQIEKTLGVNPQGAVGNTLASRLDNLLDGNGNLLPEALDRVNVLSGPISNDDVSETAAIFESKLKLNYPTQLLQSEISIIDNQIDTLLSQIEELDAIISAHVNRNATDRHPASSISVEEKDSTASSQSTVDIESPNVQDVLEDIYNKHINLSSDEITLENNSHRADQVYFDNEEVSEFVSATEVQTAIEEIVFAALDSQITHQDIFHSNGVLNKGKITSSDSDDLGVVLDSNISLSFSKSSGQSDGLTIITFEDAIDIDNFNYGRSDILTISDESDEDEIISGDYEIEDFILSEDELQIIAVKVYGLFKSDSTASTKGKISKNINKSVSEVSLIATVRESAGLTSAYVIQVANPNSAKVVSSGIKPSEITTTNRFFNISIDGGTAVSIDAFNGSMDNQTLDSIVSRLNEQFAEQILNVLAYRLDIDNSKSELAIIHNIPDDDTSTQSILISRATDDGIDSLGFSYVEDVEQFSEFGTRYYIQGRPFRGLAIKLDQLGLVYFSEAFSISRGTVDVDFLELDIKIGDILIISDAPNTLDNGSYEITNISSSSITLSANQIPSGFNEASDANTRFRVYENTVSLQEITFDKVSDTFGATLVDIFMDGNGKLFFDKKIEYSVELNGVESLITIVDYKGDIKNKEYSLVVSDGTDEITLTLDSGEEKTIRGKDNYFWITSGVENTSFKLFIRDIDEVINKILVDGSDLEIEIFGIDSVNDDSNLLISRIPYNNFNARVTGGIESPRVFSILQKGNIGVNEISNKVAEEFIDKKINELRANGVIYGLDVLDVSIDSNDFYVITVNRGVGYVAGKRFEIDKRENIITDISSTDVDKMFIALDEFGNVVFAPAIATCLCPFDDSEFVVLSTLEFDGTNVYEIDLRLFISELDLKLLNSVTVSPRSELAHFSSINKALKYAKRFGNLFPDAGTPTVHLKSGTHNVEIELDFSDQTYAVWALELLISPTNILTQTTDEIVRSGVFVDFPVNITGEGSSTIVKIVHRHIYSNITYENRGFIAIPGDKYTNITVPYTPFNDGVISFENFKMENCRISPLDMNVESDLGEPFNFSINMKHIMFDFRNFTETPLDNFIGPVAITNNESNDTSTNKGNLRVINCDFIDCYVGIPSKARSVNMLFLGNYVSGDSENGLFGPISLVADSNIYSFASAGEEQNINIIGNINTSNFEATGSVNGPNIVKDVASRWGDRVSRDLNVGGDINVTGNVSVENDIDADTITSENYAYTSTKTRQVMYTFDRQNYETSGDRTPWNGSALRGSYDEETIVPSDGGIIWPIITIEALGSHRMRIDINPNEKLTRVQLGIEPTVNGYSWTAEIKELSETGGTASTPAFTSLDSATTAVTGSSTDLIRGFLISSALDVDGEQAKLYFLELSQNSGSIRSLYWVKLQFEVNTIESGIGVV